MSKNNNELRSRAEGRLKKNKPKEGIPVTRAELQRLVHELEVHQIELELQNEELQQAHSDLDAHLSQYTDLYDFAPVGYFTLARDGTILQTNLTGSHLLGIERSRLTNRPLGLFIASEYGPIFNAFLGKVFTGGTKESCEVAIHKAGMDLLYVHIEARPYENGQQCRIAVVDISQRKQAEEGLRDSNKRYKDLVEQTSDWVWEIDTEIKYIYTNPRIFEIIGYGSAVEIIGKTLFDVMNPEESGRSKLFFEDIIQGQKSFALFENTMLNVEGHPVFFETSGIPFFDEQGCLQGYRGISRDVTARKEAEAEAVRVEALQSIENERMRLARELHDEVGMILCAIKLDLQLVCSVISEADIKLQERLQESINKVNDSIVKVRHKSAYLRPPALDVLGLIVVLKDMVEEMNQKTSMNTQLKVGPEVPEFSPEVANTLYRCIQESLTNAANHASASNLTIDLTWNSKTVTCRIRDDGIGFDINAFNDYSSNHLGLLGMKERVFLLKGTIEIKSSPGQGTYIRIIIPICKK
ncbi:MAG: hypothetical protein APF76_03280 [Desulfitibacter sp. BRH_c19]|nr:MAG: hypothetical protein APF76_03280 [Desulfitibacter sp. BRH_c19]